jgi:hypothetical protein
MQPKDTTHEQIIAKLVADGATTGKFRKSVTQLVSDSFTDPAYAKSELAALPNMQPDAYEFHPERITVKCYEVETSCFMRKHRYEAYERYWWLLDAFGWDLELVTLDRYMNERKIMLPLVWSSHPPAKEPTVETVEYPDDVTDEEYALFLAEKKAATTAKRIATRKANRKAKRRAARQPVLARKEVETIANGGDKGVLWGGCCRKVCRMGGFE